jgi:hypothetical protein
MTGATVTFLLVERDPDHTQRVQDAFLAAKIANPMLVVESVRTAASLSRAEANGKAAPLASVIVLGPGLSSAEPAEVLESIDELSCASIPVVVLRVPPDVDEVRVWPYPAPAGQLGVRLTHLAELLDGLGLVITTVVGNQACSWNGEPQHVCYERRGT